jgi:hypothetical protein
MMRKGCTPRLMLEALAAAGGSLPELVTGGGRDDSTRSDLIAKGWIARVYVLTDAGRDALARADEPMRRNLAGLVFGRMHPQTLDATNMLASLPWPRHPPVTDPDAIAQIEQEAREARSL